METLNPRIHHFLISTTSRFTGIFESEGIRIDHAWPVGDLWASLKPSPHSRNYFVISVEADEPSEKSIVVPNYSPFAEHACTLLSILFGKRFDAHGPLVTHGLFHLPQFNGLQPTTYFNAAPYNHEPRKDVNVPLKLGQFATIAAVLRDESIDEQFRRIILTAGRFYLRALQMFDVEPEFAYLDLITCGEVLSSSPFYDFPAEKLYDGATRNIFGRIKAEVSGGEDVVRQLSGKMRQIKRRYVLALRRLLANSFYAGGECEERYRLTNNCIEKRLKAAYDVRSRYVHTGVEFGHWTHPRGGILNEVQIGKPVIEEDRKFSKAIALAPTFIGMERIMRYCLLRFCHLNGVPIDSSLDDAPAA